MSDRLMTADDLARVTGCITPRAQRLWFTKHGIATVAHDDGTVVMMCSVWESICKTRSFKNAIPATEEALKPRAISIREPAVYFLMKGWDVVYVGKSTNLLARLGTHVKSEMDWDTALHLHVDKDEMGIIEMEFIARLKPRYNLLGIAREIAA